MGDLSNGDLLRVAEEAGFDVLLTTDNNIAYQQNLKTRKIAIVVLSRNRWRIVQRRISKIVAAVFCNGHRREYWHVWIQPTRRLGIEARATSVGGVRPPPRAPTKEILPGHPPVWAASAAAPYSALPAALPQNG